MLRAYFRMLGRRAVRWGFGAIVTVVFFVGAALIGLPQWAVLAAGVIGALVGSVLAYMLMQRLFGPEPVSPPPQPAPRARARGRGSGKRGS
jgi:hypothetical protein